MREKREQIIIHTLTNMSDQLFLARKAKVWKTVLKNDPSMIDKAEVLHSILIMLLGCINMSIIFFCGNFISFVEIMQ